jgi:hypothetical protein
MHRLGPSLVRTLAVVAIASAAIGCSSRSGTIVDWFTSAASDPNFQAEGPITGSMTARNGSIALEMTLSGHARFKGGDSAMAMTMAVSGTASNLAIGTIASSSETVAVGDWKYERTNGGPWHRSARDESGDAFEASLDRAGGLVDKGIESHYGRSLHRLEPRDTAAIPPDAIGLGAGQGYSDVKMTVTFWAEADGTPAGLVFDGTFETTSDGTTMDWTATLDFAFDSHSGVVIEVPEGAAEPSTAPYPESEALQSDVEVLRSALGTISGTYEAGSKSLSLKGTIRLANGSTEIHIQAGQLAEETWSEILVGGNRYVSRDDKAWVARGKKTTPTLYDVLAGAATDKDAGTVVVQGIALHRLVSPANSLDVASALGIDLPAVNAPGSRFWLLADDEGGLAGFGASLLWGAMVDNAPQSYSLDIEVLLGETDGVPVIAPRNPWTWIVDDKNGLAFGLPATFKTTPSTAGVLYKDPKAGGVFGYFIGGAGGDTAATLVEQIAQAFGAVMDTHYRATIDGQTAETIVGHAAKAKVFLIANVVMKSPVAYGFVFAAPDAQKKDQEILSDEILATIEFLR